MATRKVPSGTPYTGNPRVRFDEGDVVSATTPRRGVLLYKHVVMFGAVLASVGFVFADDPIDVNGIDDLLEKLRANNGNAGVTLRLAAGDYRMPAVPTYTNSTYGLSSILVNKLRLVGAGATPEATKLIGTGVNRVVHLLGSGTCENLTITNGCSSTKYGDLSNSTRGGCVVGNGTLTNCVVTGGLGASHGGGAAEGVTLRDCRITGNVAQFGGGTFHVYAYDTLIDNNRATSSGGGGYADNRYENCVISNNTAASSGGGASNVSLATNTVFISNSSSSYGGGVHGNSNDWTQDLKYHFWNCVFTNNFSGGNYGGGVYHGTLHNCTVVGNMAPYGGGISYANAYDSRICWNTAYRGHGGGSYCYTNAVCILSNCVFFANIASNDVATTYGGTVYGGRLEDCEIHGNAVFNTPKQDGSGTTSGCGILFLAQLDRCNVHDNYARYYGAVYRCTARDCTLRNNLAEDDSHNAYMSDLIRCDISESGTYLGSAVDSVFHDIGGIRTITTEMNPLLPEDKTKTNGAISRCYGSFTNCLIRNNGTSSRPVVLMFGHSTLFEPGPMVNCTIVSNYISDTFSTFKLARGKQVVKNCVFADNFKNANTQSDISPSGIEDGALEFTHCVYGVSSKDLSGYSDGTLWQFGVGDFVGGPRFAHNRNTTHPYEPRDSSPLVGRGQKEDWMETAFDIRGDGYPRLRDGMVDIGCYQSYLPPKGLILKLF